MENKQRESRWNKDISSSPEAGAVSSATPCWVVKHPLQPHTGLSGLEEHYRLWASLVWRKWVTSLLPEASWEMEAKRGAELFLLVSSDKMHRNGSKLHQRRLDMRNYFFIKGTVKHCKRLPREGVNIPACQCLRDIWTMPLTCLWPSLNCSGSWTRWSL